MLKNLCKTLFTIAPLALFIIMALACEPTQETFTYWNYSPRYPIMAANFDGYWTNWDTPALGGGRWDEYNIATELYASSASFGFHIDNPNKYSRNQMKKVEKNNGWLEYNGWVGYYISDDYLTIYDALKVGNGKFVYLVGPQNNGRPTKRIKSNAKIEIQTRDNGKYATKYRLYFDGVAICIACGEGMPINL